MKTITNFMRFLSASLAACLLTASIHAAEQPQPIVLRYVAVADVAEAISKQLGPDAASAILTTDSDHNSITLRIEHPKAGKARELITSLDRKSEMVQVAMTVTRKTAATPSAPAEERVLARPIIFGPPGKPMIVTFEQDGKTYEIEIKATIQKP